MLLCWHQVHAFMMVRIVAAVPERPGRIVMRPYKCAISKRFVY